MIKMKCMYKSDYILRECAWSPADIFDTKRGSPSAHTHGTGLGDRVGAAGMVCRTQPWQSKVRHVAFALSLLSCATQDSSSQGLDDSE